MSTDYSCNECGFTTSDPDQLAKSCNTCGNLCPDCVEECTHGKPFDLTRVKEAHKTNDSGQFLVPLLLDPNDVLFNNHGRLYEHQNDWLVEQLPEEFNVEDDEAYVQVLGYQIKAFEEGYIVLQVTVDVEEA